MKKIKYQIILFFVGFLNLHLISAQTPKAYEIYKSNGHKTSYKKILKSAQKVDIVFFGEEHNNPIAHWLELKLTKDLYKKNKKIILGAEMLETDNDSVYQNYLKEKIT